MRHKPNKKISARFCPLAAFEEDRNGRLLVEVRRKGRIVPCAKALLYF